MAEQGAAQAGAWRRNRGLRGYVRRTGASVLLATRIPTTRWRALPDFVIIGAQKAGTTSLYEGLVDHPDVGRAFRKEVHFFDTTRYPSLGWYRRHFPFEREGRLTGESSPYYLFHPAVPARMKRVVPDVRLIAILRDPVARAISQYHHARHWGFDDRPIDEALDPAHQDELAPPADEAWYDRHDSPARERAYLARGCYDEQLARWLEVFDHDRLLLLDSSELDGGSAIPAAHRFLGLREHAVTAVPHRNVGAYEESDAALVERLREHFRPHNDRLLEVTGRAFRWA
ncbi:MAG: sulfotransferase domain-containing protein [Actinobacteria bacterium]|nr:sulfotransferase domain-containing protein [Actinomycetota bacterium]